MSQSQCQCQSIPTFGNVPVPIIQRAKARVISLKEQQSESASESESHPLHKYWKIQLKFWKKISNNKPNDASASLTEFLIYTAEHITKIQTEIDEMNENKIAIKYAKECYRLFIEYSRIDINEMIYLLGPTKIR